MTDQLKLLNPDKIVMVPKGEPIYVRESSEEGEAEVSVPNHTSSNAVVFSLSEKTKMEIFKNPKNCDGSFILQTEKDKWLACVVEIKRSVRPTTLLQVREQLAAGMQRLFMVLAFLGIKASEWRSYCVYGIDRRSENASTDMTPSHRSVGLRSSPGLDDSPIAVSELALSAEYRLEKGEFERPNHGGRLLHTLVVP